MELLNIVQIIIAVLLIAVILMQNRGAGAGGLFGGGGGGGGNVFATKRGLEKKLFYGTILLSVLFFVVSLAIVIL